MKTLVPFCIVCLFFILNSVQATYAEDPPPHVWVCSARSPTTGVSMRGTGFTKPKACEVAIEFCNYFSEVKDCKKVKAE